MNYIQTFYIQIYMLNFYRLRLVVVAVKNIKESTINLLKNMLSFLNVIVILSIQINRRTHTMRSEEEIKAKLYELKINLSSNYKIRRAESGQIDALEWVLNEQKEEQE